MKTPKQWLAGFPVRFTHNGKAHYSLTEADIAEIQADAAPVLLLTLHEYLLELRGEWDWKKDEPRCKNKNEYDQLCADIAAVQSLLKPKT